MRHFLLLSVILALAWPGHAAEKIFDFSKFPLDQTPSGFRSSLSGEGKPGDWKIIQEDAPPALAPITRQAPLLAKRTVLAQLSADRTDEHFPLLVYDGDVFGDFTLTTKLKVKAGTAEQMAGIAFRLQDEKNYYYVRISAKGKNCRFLKIVNGQRSDPIGPEINIEKGVWYELTIHCDANHIQCLLDGKEIIPTMTDNSFLAGKFAFWTKSDSISSFADTKIIYVPRETLAESVVQEMLRKYPRLAGLKIYRNSKKKPQPEVIASSNKDDLGKEGGQAERDVIARNVIYFGKEKKTVSVTLPLHDRNGEAIAAVRVELISFPGQTEKNAVARALPIVKEMELRTRSAQELVE